MITISLYYRLLELIVITQEEDWDFEHKVVEQLFHAGLKTLHVRKPDYSTEQLADYIERIPKQYHSRIVIHSHHELALEFKIKGIHLTETHRKEKGWLKVKLFWLKILRPKLHISTTFHHLSSIRRASRAYNYIIFSPVFESISKKNHKSEYSLTKIESAVKKSRYKIVGVGGVEEDKISMAKEMGFFGVGVLGTIWKDPNPVSKYVELRDLC